jgi:integration host factor subunit beta
MKKSTLVERLRERNPYLSEGDSEALVNSLIDALSSALSQGRRIEIRGFGTFAPRYRPPRMGRNPRTGGVVRVPAKYVPHFKAGKELRERVTD